MTLNANFSYLLVVPHHCPFSLAAFMQRGSPFSPKYADRRLPIFEKFKLNLP